MGDVILVYQEVMENTFGKYLVRDVRVDSC